ncbi:MAG: prefoldin beta subunit [Acidimicrobiaceae bacterium]|jgi:hypothetical protein
MPELKLDTLAKSAKDALYVTVGLGVIAVQKAQVQRQELNKRLKSQADEAKGSLQHLTKVVEDRVKLVEERLEGVETRFEGLLDQLEERLPDQARDLAQQARTAAKDARTQARTLVSRGAA